MRRPAHTDGADRLQPVPACCTPEHPQRFSGVTAAAALDKVLYEINLVEDARRV